MIKYSLFCKFLILNAHSLEIECRFEEVYSDSTVQNGFLLIKGDKLVRILLREFIYIIS